MSRQVPRAARIVHRVARLAAIGLIGGLGGSCFSGSDGVLPPTDALYFPTALLRSPGGRVLYVANSDFDLQYSGGTVVALDWGEPDGSSGLRALAIDIAKAIDEGKEPSAVCSSAGLSLNPTDELHPGVCSAVAVSPFIEAYATVGAFASDIALTHREDEPGARLFLSVRGDPSVTFFDVPDDRDPAVISGPCGESPFCLSCGESGDENRCSDRNRIGENVFTSQRGLLLPTEPTGLALARSGAVDAIVSAHQTSGTASLVVNRWPDAAEATGFQGSPSLEFLLDGLPEAPTSVAQIPEPGLVRHKKLSYRSGFVISHRAAPTLSVARFVADESASPPRPYLVRSDNISVTANGAESDSRAMTFDPGARQACESECASVHCDSDDSCEFNVPYSQCLVDCLSVPVPFYVASRSPSSLLIGNLTAEPVMTGSTITGVEEHVEIFDSVPLPIGASKIVAGNIRDAAGELAPRIFVSSFDARFVTVFDPATARIELSIRTGRGPLGLVVDETPTTSFLVVGNFTDSYLTVVDLDQRRGSYGAPILNIGPPVAPREEQ